jgi:hypothetical protein
VKGHAEEHIGHAQQRVQQEQHQACDYQPSHEPTLVASQLGQTFLALYLCRSYCEADVGQLSLSCTRARGYLAKPSCWDHDADITEAPAHASRLPARQCPIVHQQVL